VDPKGRHTRSTPHIPLETPKADPEKIIKKGKASQEFFSTILPGTLGHLHDSTFKTPVAISNSPLLPSAEVSKSLDFENFPIEYSSFSPKLKKENFETLASPDVVSWFELENLEDFPTLGLPAPPPIEFVVTQEEETCFPLDPIPYSSNNQTLPLKIETSPSKLPLSPKIQAAFVSIKNPSPPCSPKVQKPMTSVNLPRNRMDVIVATRNAPLILPQPMNALRVEDYLNYMPKFTEEEDITAEEHLATFYSYAHNLNIEDEDVWMRVFVQSLDGEARKWLGFDSWIYCWD